MVASKLFIAVAFLITLVTSSLGNLELCKNSVASCVHDYGTNLQSFSHAKHKAHEARACCQFVIAKTCMEDVYSCTGHDFIKGLTPTNFSCTSYSRDTDVCKSYSNLLATTV